MKDLLSLKVLLIGGVQLWLALTAAAADEQKLGESAAARIAAGFSTGFDLKKPPLLRGWHKPIGVSHVHARESGNHKGILPNESRQIRQESGRSP
jgi:hypothetical protein